MRSNFRLEARARTVGRLVPAFLLACFVGAVAGQEVPDEAMRHLVRGQTAVEMAKSVEDYDLAIAEFEAAIRLAPQWAEAYYQLGLVQEQRGNLAKALTALRKYVELAPQAANAGEVKALIYKLEFRLEQTLTVQDVVEVLASFGRWKKDTGHCLRPDIYIYTSKAGEDSIRTLFQLLYYRGGPKGIREDYQTVKVSGPVVTFVTTIDVCDPKDPCPSRITSEIEVLSKTRVAVRQTIFTPPNSGSRRSSTEKYACEFVKPL